MNGQNHRFITAPKTRPATQPYAASTARSTRPEARGSSAAPSPTQPAAIIWNGSHGPTPPVSKAPVTMASAPRTKPKPRPSTRPARMRRKNIGSSPAVPALRTRSAPPMAARTPSTAMVLASRPPAATSASDTSASSPAAARTATARRGRGPGRPRGWRGTASRRRPPRRRVTRASAIDRLPSGPQRVHPRRQRPRPGQRPAHDAGSRAAATSATVSQGSGCSDLGDLRRERRGAGEHLAGGPSATTSPSARTTTRSATSAASSTSWVARTTVCAGGGQLAQDPHQPLLGRVVQAAGRLVEQQQAGGSGQDDGQREGEPLPLGQVARVQVLARPARPAGRAARGSCRSRPRSRRRRPGTRRPPTRRTAARPGSCGTSPTSRTSSAGGRSPGTRPATCTWPEDGRSDPASVASRVDLPAPLRPISAVTLAADQVEVDAAQGGDRSASHDELPHARRHVAGGSSGRGWQDAGGERRPQPDGAAAGVPHRQRQRGPAGGPAQPDDRGGDRGGAHRLGRVEQRRRAAVAGRAPPGRRGGRRARAGARPARP